LRAIFSSNAFKQLAMDICFSIGYGSISMLERAISNWRFLMPDVFPSKLKNTPLLYRYCQYWQIKYGFHPSFTLKAAQKLEQTTSVDAESRA